MGGVYSDHLKYDLPQNEANEYDTFTFRQYLANMTVKTSKYAGDQLFHTIYCDNDPSTKHFMYFTPNKVGSTQVINRIPYSL